MAWLAWFLGLGQDHGNITDMPQVLTVSELNTVSEQKLRNLNLYK